MALKLTYKFLFPLLLEHDTKTHGIYCSEALEVEGGHCDLAVGMQIFQLLCQLRDFDPDVAKNFHTEYLTDKELVKVNYDVCLLFAFNYLFAFKLLFAFELLFALSDKERVQG